MTEMAKTSHAGVVGDDDFGDGRHAYGVTAYRAEVAVLGRRFKRGPLGADVDALLHCNVVAAGYVEGFGDEAGGIGIAHVGESGPEFVVVFPAQRMVGKGVDVVSDEHEVAHLEVRVHAAGCVGDKERFYAQLLHHPHGVGNLLHGVALVVVKAALHGNYLAVAEAALDQLAAVPFDGRQGEVRNLGVGKFLTVGNVSGQFAQPGSQNDGDGGYCSELPGYVGSGLFYLFEHDSCILRVIFSFESSAGGSV